MNEPAVFISLGANVGDRLSHLQWAFNQLELHPSISNFVASPVYESEALVAPGNASQSDYLNAVVGIDTSLSPDELLAFCLSLEKTRGRKRSRGKFWEPRVLDLDILAFGPSVVSRPGLNIPHRHLWKRRFVLMPWADIAPSFWVPKPFENTVAELLANCKDSLAIERTAYTLR